MNSPKSWTITPAGTKLEGLTHLRSLAILLVLLFHYRLFQHPGWIDTAGAFGWTGVDLFFVLSGYLISSQLFKSIAQTGGFSLREFYVKRTLRIIPAYLLVLTCYFCLPWFREREALPPLWKFLSFTQNFGLDLRSHGTFSHAWSLCVEEQFYLLLPLVIMVLLAYKTGKKGFYLLPALFIAGVAIRALGWTKWMLPSEESNGFLWYKWIYYPTWNRLDGLLIGIGIAGLARFKPAYMQKITRYGNRLLLLAILLLAAAWWVCRDPQSFIASTAGFPLVAIAYGVLVLAALSPACVLYRFSSRISTTIATLSYSMYLVHKACIHITQQQFGRLGIAADGVPMFLLCMLTSAAAAFLLYRLVEQPFMNWRDKIVLRPLPQDSPHR